MRDGREKESPPAPIRKRVLREVREWTVSIAIAVLASLLIQNYAFAQTKVQNISMQKTLVDGQRLVEDKLSYKFTEPKRGDIVIIDGPESELRLVKRVIGLPGDTLNMQDGELYVNGQKQQEPYVNGKTESMGIELPYTVPQGTVFVMGDNREHSMDSRQLGPISLASLEGKVIYRVWPLSLIGEVK